MANLEERDAAAGDVAVAPRVTLAEVKALVAEERFIVVDGVLTICVMKLANGFYTTGESAPASPENFDKALGEKIARDRALEKVWMLAGYEFRSRLAAQRAQFEITGTADDPAT